MTQRVLFLVNGLGLGNSTRCHAIIQRLAEHGAEIRVVTSGNGGWYFADKPEIGPLTEVPALQYGKRDGHISIAATLSAVGAMVRAVKAADRVVAGVLDRFCPHAVVTDSTYAVRAVKASGVPLVALNNADMVVRGMAQYRDWPLSVLPQFACIESIDFLFHRLVPDLVVSPRLDPTDHAAWGSSRRVGPIVRAHCRPCPQKEGPPRRVVIMLSGSAFGSQVSLARLHPGMVIDVIGREAPAEGGQVPNNVTFHGKIRDSAALLAEADLVIVNGGFSAVSEALCLRKPMVVIPVPRHAEQWINGRTIAALGVGMSASEEALEEAMEQAVRRIDVFRDAYRVLPDCEDGASQAAELILRLIRTRT